MKGGWEGACWQAHKARLCVRALQHKARVCVRALQLAMQKIHVQLAVCKTLYKIHMQYTKDIWNTRDICNTRYICNTRDICYTRDICNYNSLYERYTHTLLRATAQEIGSEEKTHLLART